MNLYHRFDLRATPELHCLAFTQCACPPRPSLAPLCTPCRVPLALLPRAVSSNSFSTSTFRVSPSSRMRNSGGFQLPPRVPDHGTAEHTRAVELLGACTQRARISEKTREEVETLVGDFPRSRGIAQQWKKALSNRKRRASLPPYAVIRPREQHTKYMDVVELPQSNGKTARAFVLLDALRRRYWANVEARPQLLHGIHELIRVIPENSAELYRAKNALKRLQRNRKSSERRPPLISENEEDLQRVDMMLGHVERSGRIGRKVTGVLEKTIGALPRTPQIARSWQKRIKAVIRRRKRKARVARNFEIAEAKRASRSAARALRESLSQDQTSTTR